MKRTGINKEFLVQLIIAALVLIADQVTKYLVSTRLAVGETWDIAPWVAYVFSITHVTNTGVAFGLLQGLGKVFIFTRAIASIAIILYSRQLPPNQWIMRVALGLALGGSVGNLIDRVRFGGTVTDFIDTNIRGTANLLEAARSTWRDREDVRFHHVSTDEVFGSLGADGLFSEATPYDPSSPYSASKAAADHLVRAWHRTYGLPVTLSNCSNNYGPYQFPEKLVPLMILNALAGKKLPVYGEGANVRDWLHVEDHCSALDLVIRQGLPGRTYNVGGNSERTNLAVVHALCDVMDELRPRAEGGGHRELVEFVPDRPGHDLRYAIDADRIASELGWKPAHDFASGLRATVEWYLDNQEWCEEVMRDRYDGSRLGLKT